jgi:hypothetical protein
VAYQELFELMRLMVRFTCTEHRMGEDPDGAVRTLDGGSNTIPAPALEIEGFDSFFAVSGEGLLRGLITSGRPFRRPRLRIS